MQGSRQPDVACLKIQPEDAARHGRSRGNRHDTTLVQITITPQ